MPPFLDRLIGLGDTCGIHNLHGMPAILGGLVAGLASLGQDNSFLNYSNGSLQLGWQVVAMLVCMGIGIGGDHSHIDGILIFDFHIRYSDVTPLRCA